jgi:hypothetical protein
LLVVWLQLNVSGFRSVLARGWHGPPLDAELSATGSMAVVCASQQVNGIDPGLVDVGLVAAPTGCTASL